MISILDNCRRTGIVLSKNPGNSWSDQNASPASTADDCQALCLPSGQCNWWQFHTNSKNCKLFESVSENPNSNPHWVIGPKICESRYELSTVIACPYVT